MICTLEKLTGRRGGLEGVGGNKQGKTVISGKMT